MKVFQELLLKFFFNRRGLILSLSFSLIILLIFFIQMFNKAYREDGWDFLSYLISSKAFLNGMNPCATESIFPFIYPLFVCIILFPFTLLPYWIAIIGWFILSALAIYFSAFTILRKFAYFITYKQIAALILIPFFILIDVIQNNLLNGQINIILLLMCALFFKYCLESRKLLSSVFLSAAISIKLTPAIFLVYLIIRREFILFGLTVVMSVFFLFVLPYAFAGHKSIEWYLYYVQSFLTHSIAIHSEFSDGFGFSITSVFSYLSPSIPKFLSFLFQL